MAVQIRALAWMEMDMDLRSLQAPAVEVTPAATMRAEAAEAAQWADRFLWAAAEAAALEPTGAILKDRYLRQAEGLCPRAEWVAMARAAVVLELL